MSKTPLARAVALATLGASLTLPGMAQADFIGDSKATLELRNFYMNRDLRHTTSAQQSKREEWAQGFIFKAESGFTEGTVGFGLDAYAGLGVKLDSSDERAGTNLLPNAFGDEGPGEYSEATGAAKVKISKTVAKVGGMMPKLPSVSSNDARLLPQTFLGGHLTSNEIDGLTLHAGQLKEQNQRDSTNFEDLSVNAGGGIRGFTFNGKGNVGDDFNFAGLSYQLTKDLTASYHYGELEDLYKQHIFNLVHVLPIADKQSLKSDVRYARTTDDGHSNIDNKSFGAMFTYALGSHAFGLGYQSMSGDTGYAYINGTDPFLVNYVQIGDFANKDEKSWQVRYDYNFSAFGLPGLSFMTRYLNGDNIDRGPGVSDGKEWERNMDITYVVQEGTFKNLGFKWRNATLRSDALGELDENRLIVSYTIPLM
ncbi:OprD family porin [Pseudomonas sp. NPDC077649]|uniref:OprD family porin n=1 Tax=Pseudomonas sp. NPDC077649 TaxID=3364423 RepID=UPI0037C6939D